jgi:2-dehydro-3-deoxyphosphogluconate aldolase / (4S)-4-hydroxy-2-oxoglutarate aldolase
MARFSRLDVYQRMLEEALVPIFVQAEPDSAAQALAAVAEGGATVCEFTNRSPQALEAFRTAAAHASRHLPRMILGAG